MKLLLLAFTLLICSNSLFAQQLTKGNIYALIIGISEYEDEQIKDLDFAHRDAEIFADYLMSSAGGSVPTENIKLLTNKNATISKIYLAKQWLEDKAQKDDLIFFYFSGHGDVESSLYKLGFLLAHDTPHKNYFNNAVRIEDFNIMANTLSIKKEAKVVLITDACHSGKLAGSDNRGKALVGEQLSTVSNNEIRIASCESEQLSQEDLVWGGGRGVFSYYLINGLKGLADQGGDDSDGLVTLNELREYLEDKVEDDVFKLKQGEQMPVVQGKKRTLMSIVDDEVLEELQGRIESTRASGSGSTRSINNLTSPADIYFNKLSKIQFDTSMSIEAWSKVSPAQMTDLIKDKFPFDNLANNFEDNTEYYKWKSKLSSDQDTRKDFQYRLAGMFHDKIQKAINAYLVGDKEELKRRQYYDANPEEFDQYALILQKAMTLIDKSNYLHSIMEAKSHYFSGIASRIRIINSTNKDSLISHALEKQLKALSIDNRAAYVHNELGILYKLKKDYFNAEKEFKLAMDLVPKWALPVSNLSNLKYKQGKYTEGLELGIKSKTLQPDYRAGHIHIGINAIELNNYLLAEEAFIQSTWIDDNHFSGFENLGHLYTKTTDYEKANYNFIESAKRLDGFNIDAIDQDGDGIIDLLDSESVNSVDTSCEIKINKLGKKDNMAYLIVGVNYLNTGDYQNATKYIEKSIQINPYSPIAYYYLGKIAWLNKEWTRAEYLLKLAKDSHFKEDQFMAYADELSGNQKYLKCDVIGKYKNLFYPNAYNNYLLGDLYTKINNYEKAVMEYEALIEQNPEHFVNYKLLWQLYENQAQYENAEIIIHRYGKFGDAKLYVKELYAFYMRQADGGMNVVFNTYKAANILYNTIDLQRKYPNKNDDGIISLVEFMPARNDDQVNIVPGTDLNYKFAETNFDYVAKSKKHYESILDDLPLIKKAEILNKLGNLYWHTGNTDLSTTYFEDALDISSQHSSIKEKLIDLYLTNNELMKSLEQLESLYNNNQINSVDLITYSEFVTHSGQYLKSDKVTTFAKTVFPLYNQNIEIHRAKRSLFSKDIRTAISRYKKLIDHKINPGNDHYTLTRLYAFLGEKRKALKHLDKAIDKGFTYNWVLDKDPIIENLRTEKKYKKLRKRLPERNI